MRFETNTRQRVLSALLLFGIAVISGCGGKPAADNPPPAAPAAPAPPPAAIAGPAKPAPASSSAPAPAPAVSRSGNFAAALSQADKDSAVRVAANKGPAAPQPISDAEAQEFVSAFDKALTKGEAKALGEAFDDEAIIRKAEGTLALPPAKAEGYVRGVMQEVRQGRGEGGQFARRVAEGDKYHLLHVRKLGKWQCAVFRMIDNKEHMNYTDFLLARDAAGKVRISDYYDYGFAELHTRHLQREIMCDLIEDRALAPEQNPEIAEYAKYRKEIESMGRLIYDKKFSEAIDIYQKLSETMKKSRIGLILRVSASPRKPAGDEEAQAFVAEFVKCVMSGDAEGVQKSIDSASFYRRATANLEIPSEMKLGLEASFRSANGAHIGRYFHLEKDQIENGAAFSLLRLHANKAGERRATFRHVFSDGRFEHCDCVLEQFADGKVRIADYYDLDEGGMRSELYGLLLADDVKNNKPASDDARQPRTKDPNEPPTLGEAFLEMQNRVNGSRYAEALDYYMAACHFAPAEEIQRDEHPFDFGAKTVPALPAGREDRRGVSRLREVAAVSHVGEEADLNAIKP
jgi:hypothetical protein